MKLVFEGHQREVTLHKVITAEVRGKAADRLAGMKPRDYDAEILSKMMDILTTALSPEEMMSVSEENARTLFIDKMKAGQIKPEAWKEVMQIVVERNNNDVKPDIIKGSDLQTIEFYKAMIFMDGIEDGWQKLIALDADSTFWQGQDIMAMEEELSGFCGQARLGKYPLT